MIGRDEEVAGLLRLLKTPGTVFISGEAGIGKTTLVAAALVAGWSGTGPGFLRAACREEARAPFAVFADLLRAAPWAIHLADGEEHLEELCDSVVSAVGARGVVVLEDLHWASPDGLDLVPRFADRLYDRQVSLVGTYRDAGLGRRHRLRWVRSELRRTGRLEEIRLRPLNQDQALRLVSEILPTSAAVARAIYERSRGVPFYARELALALGRGTGEASPQSLPLPTSVRDAVARRLYALDAEARADVCLAAVLGEAIDLPLFTSLGGDPDRLRDSGFMADADDGGAFPTSRLRFTHGLVRDALRAETPWRTARDLHRRVAHALESRGAHPRTVADHLAAAGDADEARVRLSAAARAFEDVGARREAARAARDALRLARAGATTEMSDSEQVDLLWRLARNEQDSGELEGARVAYRDLVDHPRVLADQASAARAWRGLARVSALAGRDPEALQAHRQAEAAFRATGEDAEVAVELLQQIAGLTAGMRLGQATQAARNAARLAERAGRFDLQARALGLQGHLLAMAGRIEEARASAEAGFALAVQHELGAVSAETYRRLGGVLEYSSDLAGATEVYGRAVDQCRRIGAREVACDAMGCMCYVVFRAGDYGRSLQIAREVLANPAAPAMARATALMNIASVHAARGDARSAGRAIEQAEDFCRRRDYDLYLHIMRMPRASLAWSRGDDEAALDEYLGLLGAMQEMEDRHVLLPGLCQAAGLLAEARREEALGRAVSFLTELESTTGDPESGATLIHSLGAAALLSGRADDALSRFTEAALRYARIGVPVEEAHSRLWAGIAAGRLGRDAEAADHIRSARAICRRIGARASLTLISRKAAGLAGGSAPATVAEILSPRQREIAALLVAGYSNKEMAARLFVSTRTAEMHVAAILDRLSCRSRTEAAARLQQMGITAPADESTW